MERLADDPPLKKKSTGDKIAAFGIYSGIFLFLASAAIAVFSPLGIKVGKIIAMLLPVFALLYAIIIVNVGRKVDERCSAELEKKYADG